MWCVMVCLVCLVKFAREVALSAWLPSWIISHSLSITAAVQERSRLRGLLLDPGKAVTTPTILPNGSQLFLGRELARSFWRFLPFFNVRPLTHITASIAISSLYTGNLELWSRSNKLDLKIVP